MSNLESLKDLKFVRMLAKRKAQKNGEDQAIYKAKVRGVEVYQFIEATNLAAGIIEIVRYTKPIERRDILQDNGNKRPIAIKKKTKSKGKNRTDS